MATVGFKARHSSSFGDRSDAGAWDPLHSGDDGSPQPTMGAAERSIQVEGDFGPGGELHVEGTNDGENFRLLTDHVGNPLRITSPQLVDVLQSCVSIRPRVSGGDATTALHVTLMRRMVA